MLATAPRCAFEVERGPDWLLVRIRNIAIADESRFAEMIWRALEQHFTYRVVLELDGVPRLNAAMIGQLVELHRRIAQHDGVLRLCGLSPDNCRALEVCGLGGRLHPYDSRTEALIGDPHPVRLGF